MARQTSKNRWVNGKRTLKWRANDSEFAGGHEMGTAIELGSFTVEENGEVVDRETAYDGNEKQEIIRLFLKCGEVNPPAEFTEDDVVDILYQALRRANDNRINDVTTDKAGIIVPYCQIILTTDNGDRTQRWVLSSDCILETDPV